MDLIYHNPFRVLGIPVTATDREIAKQTDDLSIYTNMGKPIQYDSDDFFPVKPVRTPESIQEAKQRIDQPNNKLFYASFWFWEDSNNIVDEMAFEELKSGNPVKAIEFWERETGKLWENEKGEGINSNNKSNYKNLSIAQLGLSVENKKLQKNHFLNGLSFSGKFLANGYFEEFSKEILGARHSVEVLEIKNRYVDEIISMVKPHIGWRKSEHKVTHKELLDHFKYFPDSIQIYTKEKFTGKNIHNIEMEIEKAAQFRKDDKSIANKAGFELYKNTKNDIKQLQGVLSNSDLKYEIIADKLAAELIDCSIAYFNKHRDTDIDPGDDALKLAKYAKKIAIGDKEIDRINNGIPIIEDYAADKPRRKKLKPVQSEINFINHKVKQYERRADSIKDANSLIDECENKLIIIKTKLTQTNEDYIQISSLVVSHAFGKLIGCFNEGMDKRNKYVEWQNKMNLFDSYGTGFRGLNSDIFGGLSSSLQKPAEYSLMQIKSVVKEVWTTIEKIKKLDMSNQTQEHFNRNRNSIKSVCKDLNIPTNDGCYIATMVYGSYDASEVIILRQFRDKVLLQSISGLIFVKAYYKFSPKVVAITKNIKFLHSLFRSILDSIIKLLVGSK